MDAEKLILLIQERECLWNHKSEHYHSRDIQRRFWNEVAEETNNKVEELKKKWRGLRDIFRRECKKAIASKSGDQEEYIPKWPYYKIMLFLKDTMTTRDSRGSVPPEVDEGDANESDSEPVLDCTTENDQPSTSQRVSNSPPKKVVKRLRDVSDFDKEERLKMYKEYIEDDSEMQFLKSLHPFLKRIPHFRQMAVRADIMQIFCQEAECSNPRYFHRRRAEWMNGYSPSNHSNHSQV
ncbi:uncharacterized protein LOC106665490 [Cimex lectularius]|uniref:MADF domain-containing protein n=1 Tax=Cimex lectularius TaxID=79782 RepID=A0A8I6RSN0_CIMLE|nr:uncharacterized protein LOC106665490 [Cimex lectularius]